MDGIPETHSVQKRQKRYRPRFRQKKVSQTVVATAVIEEITAATAPDMSDPTMAGKIPPAVPGGIPSGPVEINFQEMTCAPLTKIYRKTKITVTHTSRPLR